MIAPRALSVPLPLVRRRPGTLSLRAQRLLLVLLVSVPPLVINASVVLSDSRQMMRQQGEALLQSRADGLARVIDSFHESLQRASLRLSLQPPVLRFCLQATDARPAPGGST